MKKGFTLIELLAVILILGIIALIAIPAVTNVIEDSKKNAAKVTAMSYIKAIDDQNALYKLQPDKFTPINSGSVNELTVNKKGDGPTSGTVTITNGKVSEASLCTNGYLVSYNGVSATVGNKCGVSTSTTDVSLLSYVEKINESGIYRAAINSVTYDLNVIVLNGNQTITTNTNYGSLDDCASGINANQMAKRMVVVKVNGDYTVNSNVTVGPVYNETYGGPKGFLLYVTGTLTNNGTIDNSHGAYAEGQNVYLWQNANGTYEYVPAVGGLGGEPAQTTGSVYDVTYRLNGSNGYILFGKSGANGVNRQTGGGASGAAAVHLTTNPSTSGAGQNGTSYSGGAGGGGSITRTATTNAFSAENYGGSGGNANAYTGSGSITWYAGGGAGNPGGQGWYAKTGDNGSSLTLNGTNGTGGLLILCAKNVINNGYIQANGSSGGYDTSTQGPGGSSGGGSINIFYVNGYTGTGTVLADGGNYHYTYQSVEITGGAGGNGAVTYTQISF